MKILKVHTFEITKVEESRCFHLTNIHLMHDNLLRDRIYQSLYSIVRSLWFNENDWLGKSWFWVSWEEENYLKRISEILKEKVTMAPGIICSEPSVINI